MKRKFIALLVLCFCSLPVMADADVPALDEEQKAILQSEIGTDVFNKDEVVTYKTFKISGVDTNNVKKAKNRLVIYTPLFGKTTNTDLKGFEAVVVNNRVVKLNQSNSFIPENGYVVSGYGEAKKFITQNFFEGADVEIDFSKSEIKIVSRPDNYVYEANYRINKAVELLQEKEANSQVADNMNFYITKAEEILYRTKKVVEFEDYEQAQKMAEDSMIYSDMALFSSLPFVEDEFRGIYVFPYQKSKKEVQQAFNTIERLNIDYIFLESYFNGNTIYKSSVQKEYNLPEQNRSYRGFDPLRAWIEIAKLHNKNVVVVLKVFDVGNPPKSTIKSNIVSVHSDWLSDVSNKNAYYLNPENKEVQEYLLKLIAEVQSEYQVAGVTLSGLGLPNKLDTTKFINRAIINKTDDKILAIEVASDFNNYNSILLDENIILLPLLKSPDENFAKDFLLQVKNNANNAKIYPVYFEPYNEEKPRRLFDKINIARDMNLNGIVLYDLDLLDKKYYDALRLSIFKSPSTKKQKHLFVKEEKETTAENTMQVIEKEEEKDGITIEN